MVRRRLPRARVRANQPAAAVVGRTQTTTGDRDVWALDLRPGDVFLAYQRGSTVYWASASDRSLAEQFIAAMP